MKNTTLKFKIENQFLKRIESTKIISKSKNILKATFYFDSDDWLNINKFAIFKDSWGHSSTVHLGKNSKETCTIPHHVLNGTYFKVSVYAGDLISTNNISIPLLQSGYQKHHHKHNRCDSSKDIFVEIFDKLDKKMEKLIFADDCIKQLLIILIHWILCKDVRFVYQN